MSTSLMFIGIAYLVTLLNKGPVALAMKEAEGGYDNKNPREQQASQTGWGARAVAAQKNGYEAFSAFAPAVLVAHLGGGDQLTLTLLASLFIVARIGYTWAYIKDMGKTRSAVWAVGNLSTFALYALPFCRCSVS